MPLDPEVLADAVVQTVDLALGPVLARLAAAEARLETLGDVRDRLVAVETKADRPTIHDPAIEHHVIAIETKTDTALERLATIERRVDGDTLARAGELGGLRERVAVLETRPLVPGPPGEPGPPGKDGLNGKDGTAGLSYEGVFIDGAQYDKGQCVTWGGSMWHCNEPTLSKPGDGSKAWTLVVKRGRDGRDGIDAPSVPVVSVGKGR